MGGVNLIVCCTGGGGITGGGGGVDLSIGGGSSRVIPSVTLTSFPNLAFDKKEISNGAVIVSPIPERVISKANITRR